MRTLILRLILPLLIALPSPAFAWWEYGHQTVATIAAAGLTPKAKRAVARLIAQSAKLETPECPVRNMEDASVWPDCIKKLGDRFSYAEYWHYQDIPICKAFNIKAECPNGQCVTTQIPRMARMLKDGKLPVRERVQALAFLVHLVGDMHQPLHIADTGDAGGNRTRVAYGAKSPDKMNLHRVWDGELAERAISTPPGNAKGLMSEITAEQRAAWTAGDVTDWARESWQLSRDTVYGKLPVQANVCEAKLEGRVMLGQDYIAGGVPAVREAVEKAGVRLAVLLNAALDPPPAPEPGAAAAVKTP